MCLRKLATVDDSLEVLEAPKEYQRLRNWIIRIIVGWIVYIFYRLAYMNFFKIFFLHYDVTEFWSITLYTFLFAYSEQVIILSVLISATILGLVHITHVYTFIL